MARAECRRAAVAPAAEALGEAFARQRRAALVERDKRGLARPFQDGASLLGAPIGVAAGAAFGDLDDLERREAARSAKRLDALAIALGKVALGTALQPSDRDHGEPHGPAQPAMRSRGRSAPHIFSRL